LPTVKQAMAMLKSKSRQDPKSLASLRSQSQTQQLSLMITKTSPIHGSRYADHAQKLLPEDSEALLPNSQSPATDKASPINIMNRNIKNASMDLVA